MRDVVQAVKTLVQLATSGGTDAELRSAIDAVLIDFRPKGARNLGLAKQALRVLTKGIAASKGRATQVLLLALGALVEAGAAPELAWPAIEAQVAPVLAGAEKFAQECLDRSELQDLEDAVKREGEGVRKDYPRLHAAWALLRAVCMAANACLTRSPKLRARTKKSSVIVKALGVARTLESQVDEVRAFDRILRLCCDEPLIVIHPESRKGWRFVMTDLASNVELYVLLLDQIVQVAGAPLGRLLKAKRPAQRALTTLQSPDKAPKGAVTADTPFHMVQWTGLRADLTLPHPQTDQEMQHTIWLEGVPGDISTFESERVILLQESLVKRKIDVDVPYDALHPTLKRKRNLTAAEVDLRLAKMAKAAAKLASTRRLNPSLAEARTSSSKAKKAKGIR